MASKLQFVSELANQTAHTVTRDIDGWKRYLTTASRLYKYPFDEQLLIYAQRPDATACASMELWNDTMRRWVKPRSKGIALIRKNAGGRPQLEYVFDVADTRPVKGARTPYLWEMRTEHHAAVAEALEQQYGPSEEPDFGYQLMEQASHAVKEVYREHLDDLAYDVKDSLLEELDDLNLEVRFRNLLTASVQYTLLTRCGLDPADYMEDEDLSDITEFSTPAVLHHLGSAASEVSMNLLNEIGRAVRTYDREQAKNNQRISEKPLAKSPVIDYTKVKEEFSTVKRESEERSIQHGGADLHEGGRLPDSRPDAGRRGRTGGNAPGQVRDAAGDVLTEASQGDVQLHAADRTADPAPERDRPAGGGTGGQDRERPDETERRERSDEGPRPDGVGTGGEQLHSTGGGNGAGGDRLQVNPEGEEPAAGEQPVASSFAEPDLSLFSLFPTVEEQIENIAQAQAEEQQAIQQHTPTPAGLVPSAVIGRALTSGGNEAHSIEHIVSFFQKVPTGSAASFMAKEFGEGGKGVKIAGKDYSLWFDSEGFRIAPGRSAFGPGSTLISWVDAADMTANLLRDGMFATQEKINAAPENEVRELAEKLWYLRQDFSDYAREQNLLPTVSNHFFGKGFPDDTKEIAELLKRPVSRQQIMREMAVFADAYQQHPDLLRFHKIHDPQKLYEDIYHLFAVKEQYQAIDGFAPVKASFITEDEIKQLLMRGGNISESKLRIYAYYKQGHDVKECAAFLRQEYGDSGSVYGGYNTSCSSKGVRFTRSDEESGFKGYDTVQLNWNQVQKRVRDLIDSGQYLTLSEKNFLPEYENRQLARRIYHFYSIDPNRTNPPGADMDAAVKKIYAVLAADDPEKESALFHEMFSIMAAVPPDSREYQLMAPVLRDMEAVTRDEYSLYAPLSEAVLQAERQEKQAAKEAKRASSASKRTPPTPPDAPEGELAAAARALAQKMQMDMQENEDGQLSFDMFGTPAQSVTPPPEPPRPTPSPKKPIPVETPPSPDLTAEQQQQTTAEEKGAAARYDLGYGHMGNGLTVWNRLEEEHGDYKTVAHIAPDRTVTFYDQDMPEEVKAEIRKVAATTEMSISATQDTPVFSTPPQVPEQEHAPQMEPASGDQPTIRQIYEQYVPVIQDLVRNDPTYQTACANSDKETAYREGGEAILRAVRTMEDPVFLRQYFDNASFHNRLHRDVLDKTYPMLSQSQQEHEQIEGNNDIDTIPRNFEFQYRLLSRLKSDCEYFLGAGGRAAKHLAEGGIDAQIAKMRELYDLLPEKPEWLTAEDIDRYEAQMNTPVYETTVSNYQATVTAEEAPLLTRLLAARGISAAQFVHDNGDVTFSFAAAVRETVEHLIAKLRKEISRAVKATMPKKAGRTRPELNYRKFAKMFPEIASGEYRYLRMESGPGMMPLHLQWIDADVIAVSHTYTQNGDVMRDPEMTFRMDREKGTLEPLTFQQDGSLQRYQEVYPEPGKWRPKLRNSLNGFAQQWFKNISQQNYHKHEAVMVRNGADVDLTFDQDGKPVEVVPEVSPEPATPETEAPAARDPLAPAYQVGDTVYVDDRRYVIASMGQTHVQIEDTAQQYPSPRPERIADFEQLLMRDRRNNGITAFLAAHLPDTNDDLRDALTGDGGLLELRDKAVIAGYIQAGENNFEIANRLADTYAGAAETMTLLTGEQADYFADKSGVEVHIHDKFNTKVSMTWNLIAPILRALYQQELDGFLHEQPAEDISKPEQQESVSIPLDQKLLEPAYKVGDTVYIENKPFIISEISPPEVQLQYPNAKVPLFTSEKIARFEYLLRQDTRNEAVSEYLSTGIDRIRPDVRGILTANLLSEHDRNDISRWFRSGEGNTKIAERIEKMFSGRADTASMQKDWTVTGEHTANYSADARGFHVTHPLYAGFEPWEEVAAILRSLWQQELDGFSHEPPATEHSEPEHEKSGVETPPTPEAGPEPTEAGTSEQVKNADEVPVEHDFAPNAEGYWNLKAQHPDKLVGVQVGEFMMFYGKDAEEAASALGTKAPVLDIPGIGKTPTTGSRAAWQYTLKKLLEHGKSVVLAQPDPERGPDAPYEIIKERDAAEYIPVGMELTIDGRRMKIDSVAYGSGTVSLMDLDTKGLVPVFRVEPIPFVRQFVEEQQDRDFEVSMQQDIEPLTVGAPEEQDQTEADDLETAKQLISDFCADEYQTEEMDFSNPEHIGIAYTTTEDEKHEIQVEVNLLDFSISQLVDDKCVERRSYNSLRELIDNELTGLDFDELVRLEHDLPPEPVRVELDGGKVTPPPAPVTIKEVGRVDTGAFEVVFQELRTGPEKYNFQITDDNLGAGGDKTKYQYNVAAIRTLKQIEADGRLATPEEQEILSRYVGWGGLAQAFDPNNEKWAKEYAELKDLLTPEEYASARTTTVNAHYTSPTVIKAIYQAVENMDYQPGTVLEPSMGIGNFFGLLPESMAGASLHGVELDDLTGRIAKQLYQKADIAIDGFENTDHPDNYFDLAVGNVPFGEYGVHDRRYDRQNLLIHDYFITKTLDKVRPGGIVAFVTSKGTLDKKNSKVRAALAQKADLLGAVRLPNNAFKANAGTEVTTDILFFQKRDRAPEKLPEWVESGLTTDGVPLNRYFLDHPEMVLGTMVRGKSMYGNETETACIPIEGADLSQQLAEAVQHISPPNRDLLKLVPPEQENGKEIESIPADPTVRNFSYALSHGKLYFRENSRMNRAELGKVPTERVKGMIAIRDSTRKLIDLQLRGAGDGEVLTEQANLNRLYDQFTKKYGLLNSAGNRLAFRKDSSYPLLCSLEVIDDKGNLERKADMFTKRTIQHHQPVTSVDTAAEALAVSISEKACVDLGFMASLMGGGDKIPQIVKDLQGIIFKDPNTGPFDIDEGGTNWYKGWQTADEYLSGDVRKKLIAARAAAEQYPEFAVNAEKLEQVQPKELTAAEIDIHIGAPWVKPRYYKQFLFELLKTPWRLQDDKIDVLCSETSDHIEWNVKGKSEDKRDNPLIWSTYGTKRRSAYSLFEDALNLRDARVYDTVYEDGKEKRVLNQKESMIAQQKQEAIGEAFRNWIFKDPDRRADLCATYNRLFNSIRPREYNGDHIQFTGMNPEYKLEPHQRNAVARMLYGGNALLAHCVGAGKTFEMIAAAMEGKRLGLNQKSLFVVPNHLTEQWGGDFLTLYPGAKVLVATREDFTPAKRKQFCAKIATGDYDAIVIGHSQFEKIPLSSERQKRVIQDQIDEIVTTIKLAKLENGEKWSIKRMEATKLNLEAKLKKLNDKKKDDTVTFEELGVDRLFVDEAHYYKNLFMHTKMRNVAGISQTEAQKSSDMFGKCRYMDELTGGKGVTFATGTPISNSMVELYTMMRYLQFDMLVDRGMRHFDSWAASFGEKVTAVELKPEGTGFRAKTRFARFFNLPELMNLWKEAADIQTADMLKLPVPEAEYITISTEPSEAQKEMVQALAERAELVRQGKVEPTQDNMLKITSDGRKLALDQRIANPLLPDDPGSKVNACVDNVFNIWQESAETLGTQLIFSDLSTPKGKAERKPAKGKEDDADQEQEDEVDEETVRLETSVYEDIRDKLIAKGVPAEEIAFIHQANTEAQKEELFSKVRDGKVRILLGSTQKMGAGTNCQTKLIASHDLDCPWRPADLEQRAGRIIRRGNENKKVKIFRYVTKGTFDAYNWGLVENKQKFIGQVMTSKSPARSIEDVDATALSYAEVKMIATGDPRIKEKMDLDIQVAKLKMLKSNHMAQKYEMEDMVIRHYPKKMAEAQMFIEALSGDLPVLEAHPVKDDAFSMTVQGKTYTERKEAGLAIVAACKTITDPKKVLDLGEYRGFPMQLHFDGAKFRVTMKQNLTYTAELSDDVVGNILRINNALEKIPKNLEGQKRGLENLQKDLETARQEVEKPFPQEAELETKSARLSQLNIELDNDGGAGLPSQDGNEAPARDGSNPPMPQGDKPSIIQSIRSYTAPAPASPSMEKSQRREAAL